VAATETDPDMNDNSLHDSDNGKHTANGPSMLDPNLSVKTVVSGLSQRQHDFHRKMIFWFWKRTQAKYNESRTE